MIWAKTSEILYFVSYVRLTEIFQFEATYSVILDHRWVKETDNRGINMYNICKILFYNLGDRILISLGQCIYRLFYKY